MKREKNSRNYYEEYLEICRFLAPSNGMADMRKNLGTKKTGNGFNLPFGTCLMDYSKSEYTYISDHCDEILSYSKKEYMEGGFEFHARTFHPEDRELFSGRLFRDIRNFWDHIAPEDMEHYRFSFNHRYIRRDGTTSQMLQQSTYMEPNHEGVPVLNLLTFSDIGDFKTDTSMVLTISRFVNGMGYVKVFSKSYDQSENVPLTKRESEILKLCLSGLTSKLIAEKLNLSLQTVKNHKRNMMEKAAVRNMTGLINLSIKNNWI